MDGGAVVISYRTNSGMVQALLDITDDGLMNELASRLIATAGDLFGYRGKLIQGSAPEAVYLVDNPNRRCPNIDKARSHLGYEPGISIEEGLRRSLIWYHHNQQAEEA